VLGLWLLKQVVSVDVLCMAVISPRRIVALVLMTVLFFLQPYEEGGSLLLRALSASRSLAGADSELQLALAAS
jgi:hypothetical protein